ncbi:MAG: polyphosphate kinase [Planctomycetaceae bacterium]|nr:polyphosphate kinase [Planctomycetaceae bacterium]
MVDIKDYRVSPGDKVHLDRMDTEDDGGLKRDEGEARFTKLVKRLQDLQELMYAQHKHALLVVFQAMDAGGKDSTIRHVLGPLNPMGCRVTSFKGPNTVEQDHDFLWRVHQSAPRRGRIHVFNRSHYEDVLIVRVKGFAPEKVWRKRYEHINAFEAMLGDEGTTVVKFYLHISKGYQKERLQRRLDRPDKQWKFNPNDLKERAQWEAYQEAFTEALERCTTKDAPWYVVPAERRWFRDLLVAEVLTETLESLKMKMPKVDFDASKIVIE